MFNGSLLRALREQKRLTQSQVADAIGVTQSAIGAFERGDRTPRPSVWDDLSAFFDVDRSYFSIQDDTSSRPAVSAKPAKASTAARPTTQGDVLRAVATLAAVGHMRKLGVTPDGGATLTVDFPSMDEKLRSAVANVAGMSLFATAYDSGVNLNDLIDAYLFTQLPALDELPLTPAPDEQEATD